MSLLSLAYLLLDRPMQKRFESDPLFQATTLLLAGTDSKGDGIAIRTAPNSPTYARRPRRCGDAGARLEHPNTPVPEVQLLSNGRYHVMVTNAGGGYSRWKDLAVTRWREDSTCDNWGTFCYIRDVESGEFWSTAYQPTLKPHEATKRFFPRDARNSAAATTTSTRIPRSSFRRKMTSSCAESASPTARGTRRTIDITSYAEVVLASSAADALHPAFSNLFVQTEIIRERQAILCTRRPRSLDEQAAMDVSPDGRARSRHRRDVLRDGPHAVHRPRAHVWPARSHGGVRRALGQRRARCSIRSSRSAAGSSLDPEESATVDMVSGIGETRDALSAPGREISGPASRRSRLRPRVDAQPGRAAADSTPPRPTRNSMDAWPARSSMPIRSLRADAAILIKNRRGQSGLWGYAISGDLPIVLLQIGDAANIDLVRQLVQAHAYWRLKGLAVDLVIWNEDHAGYRQVLQEQIMGLIAAASKRM